MENQTVKPVSFFRFEDLRVYHKSLDYFTWIVEQTKTVDEFERKMIVKPLCQAASKVSTNIAEGSSRHKSQFVNFLKDAKSAVRECVVLSTMAKRTGVFNEEQFTYSNDILVEMTKMVGAMIVSLQKNTPREEGERENNYNTSSDIDFEY